MDYENWLTTAQAARVAGVTGERIRQLCRQGRLRYESTPLGRLVWRESLLRYCRERGTR